MESQLTEPHTFAAQNYAQSFFRELPTDSRFLQCSFQKFPPNTSLDATTIEFSLNRFTAANVYQIQNTHIEVQIVILKASDNKVPDTAKTVAPANSILQCLFQSVQLKINDQPITRSPDNYPYKAYITNTLTFGASVKAAQLQSEGFYSDIAPYMGPLTNNGGWEQRCTCFRKGSSTAAYKEEGARFFGRLHLDLMSCPTGLIPGTKVDIELKRATDDFIIMKDAADSENYKVKLLSCFLYVPVAQLSSLTFSEIERVLVAKSVAIHYRRIEIRQLSLSAGKEEYNSENLFPSDLPCRIVICFIESKNKTGDQKLNPFDFRRKWVVTTSVSDSQSEHLSQRERYLEQELLQMKKQFALFQSCLAGAEEDSQTSAKGKGRGKRSTPQASTSEQNTSLFVRLRNSFSGPTGGTGGASSRGSVHSEPSTSSDQPPPYSEVTAQATTTTIWIKQVELLLNGAPLDQVDSRETEDDCIFTFWKMYQNGGFANSLFSCNIRLYFIYLKFESRLVKKISLLIANSKFRISQRM